MDGTSPFTLWPLFFSCWPLSTWCSPSWFCRRWGRQQPRRYSQQRTIVYVWFPAPLCFVQVRIYEIFPLWFHISQPRATLTMSFLSRWFSCSLRTELTSQSFSKEAAYYQTIYMNRWSQESRANSGGCTVVVTGEWLLFSLNSFVYVFVLQMNKFCTEIAEFMFLSALRETADYQK